MSLCWFLCPAFIWPVQPVTSNHSLAGCLMSRTTATSDFCRHTSFITKTCAICMTASVWFDWPVKAAVGAFSELWWIVGSGSMTLGDLKEKVDSIYRHCVKYKELRHNGHQCHCLTNPGSISNIFETFWLCFNGSLYIYSKKHTVRIKAYLVVKLTGGRWSAKTAAAVTELPLRLDDCQLGLSRAQTVRRAQRNCWDLTEERPWKKRGQEERWGERTFFESDTVYEEGITYKKLSHNILYILLHTDLLHSFWTSSYVQLELSRAVELIR